MQIKSINYSNTFPIVLSDCIDYLNFYVAGQDDNVVNQYISEVCLEYQEANKIILIKSPSNVIFTLNSFAYQNAFPLRPFVDVISIKYYDTNNTLQTMNASDYIIHSYDEKKNSILEFDYNYTLPSVYNRVDTITIEASVGFDNNNPITPLIKQDLIRLVASKFNGMFSNCDSGGSTNSSSGTSSKSSFFPTVNDIDIIF